MLNTVLRGKSQGAKWSDKFQFFLCEPLSLLTGNKPRARELSILLDLIRN